MNPSTVMPHFSTGNWIAYWPCGRKRYYATEAQALAATHTCSIYDGCDDYGRIR